MGVNNSMVTLEEVLRQSRMQPTANRQQPAPGTANRKTAPAAANGQLADRIKMPYALSA